MSADESTRSGRKSKIERLIVEYDLPEVGEELERRWLGRDGERQSLRSLADWFNQRLLEATVDESTYYPLSGDLSGVYEVLTGDDVSEGERMEVRNRLEQNDIDADKLESDFVSHQTIYRYLTDVRGAQREQPTDEEQVEKKVETIQRLRSRTTAVTEQSIESLRSTERITVGDFTVFNDLQVICNDCGSSYDVRDLLERGGCDCQTE